MNLKSKLARERFYEENVNLQGGGRLVNLLLRVSLTILGVCWSPLFGDVVTYTSYTEPWQNPDNSTTDVVINIPGRLISTAPILSQNDVLKMSGSNTFQSLEIEQGMVGWLANFSAGTAPVSIKSGGMLVLQAVVNEPNCLTNDFTISGRGNGWGALRSEGETNGSVSLQGSILVDTSGEVNLSMRTSIDFCGNLSGGSLVISGVGTFRFTDAVVDPSMPKIEITQAASIYWDYSSEATLAVPLAVTSGNAKKAKMYKTGDGRLVLTGESNLICEKFDIEEGEILLSSTGTLGSVPIKIYSGAGFLLDGNEVDEKVLSNPISGSGSGLDGKGAIVLNSGVALLSGEIQLTGETLVRSEGELQLANLASSEAHLRKTGEGTLFLNGAAQLAKLSLEEGILELGAQSDVTVDELELLRETSLAIRYEEIGEPTEIFRTLDGWSISLGTNGEVFLSDALQYLLLPGVEKDGVLYYAVNPAAVPEPATWVLFLATLLLGVYCRQRRS